MPETGQPHATVSRSESSCFAEVSSLQTRVEELETELRAHRLVSNRLRRQLVTASYHYAQLREQLASADLEALLARREFYHAQIRFLMSALEGYYNEIKILLRSPQWRLGERIGRLAGSIRGGSSHITLAKNCEDAYHLYLKWRAGFESHAERIDANTLLRNRMDFTSPAQLEAHLQRVEIATQHLRNELLTNQRDVLHLSEHFAHLCKRTAELQASSRFRMGLMLVGHIARFRKQPNTAMYLVRLEQRHRQFEAWQEAYTAHKGQTPIRR